MNKINSNHESGFKLTSLDLQAIGHIGGLFSDYLCYQLEIKKVNSEINRVNKEAELKNNVVDKAFKIRMAEIKERRTNLDKTYHAIHGQLNNQHIQVATYSKVIDKLSDGLLNKDLSIEQREVIKQTISILSSVSVEITKTGTASLNILAEITKKVIDTLPQIPETFNF